MLSEDLSQYTNAQRTRMHANEEMIVPARAELTANGWLTNCYCISHLGFYRLWAFAPSVGYSSNALLGSHDLFIDTELGVPIEKVGIVELTRAWRQLAWAVQQRSEVWVSHNGRRVR